MKLDVKYYPKEVIADRERLLQELAMGEVPKATMAAFSAGNGTRRPP